MWTAFVEGAVLAFYAYVGVGAVFALGFSTRWVDRFEENAAHGSWGFRVLLFPGAVALWPLLARRAFSRHPERSPTERNAHRDAARSEP